VTAKGWLAIALTTVLLAAATIAVGETIKWIRKPAAEPAAAVTKPAEPQPNDALEPNQWSDSYKKKGLISDIEEFVTPQTPATSDGQTPQTPATSGGGSRGTGSSQAPAGNVQAPTGTSEGESGIQIAAAPVETPSETPSESPSATPSETPLPPDPGGEGSGEGGGGGGGSGAAKHEPPAGVGDSTKIAAAPPATEQHTQPPPDDSSMGGTHHPT
jgi:hypothetical protein